MAPFHTAHYEKTEQLRTDNGDSAYATFRIQMFRTMDCAALYRVKVDEEIFTQLSLRGSIVRESRRRKGFLESAVLCFERIIRRVLYVSLLTLCRSHPATERMARCAMRESSRISRCPEEPCSGDCSCAK